MLGQAKACSSRPNRTASSVRSADNGSGVARGWTPIDANADGRRQCPRNTLNTRKCRRRKVGFLHGRKWLYPRHRRSRLGDESAGKELTIRTLIADYTDDADPMRLPGFRSKTQPLSVHSPGFFAFLRLKRSVVLPRSASRVVSCSMFRGKLGRVPVHSTLLGAVFASFLFFVATRFDSAGPAGPALPRFRVVRVFRGQPGSRPRSQHSVPVVFVSFVFVVATRFDSAGPAGPPYLDSA